MLFGETTFSTDGTLEKGQNHEQTKEGTLRFGAFANADG